MENHDRIIVSISCITFNHSDYIRDTLEGFLKQVCNFKFEVLIHDDASTDGTSDIILEYSKNYPEIFKPIIQKENQYSQGVRGMSRKYNYPRAKGRYIALCEGDDCWIDEFKLQKQIDVMSKEKSIALCFHNAKVEYTQNINKVHLFNSSRKEGVVDFEDILNKWIIPTASIVIRKDVIDNYPEWANKVYSGDFTLSLIALSKGDVYYLNEVMSIYRINYKGDSVSAMLRKKNVGFVEDEHIKLLEYFDCETKGIYGNQINKRINALRKQKRFLIMYSKSKILTCIFFPKKILKLLHNKLK